MLGGWATIPFALSGPVAQLGERYNRTVEVRGSSPLRSIVGNDNQWHIDIKDAIINSCEQE